MGVQNTTTPFPTFTVLLVQLSFDWFYHRPQIDKHQTRQTIDRQTLDIIDMKYSKPRHNKCQLCLMCYIMSRFCHVQLLSALGLLSRNLAIYITNNLIYCSEKMANLARKFFILMWKNFIGKVGYCFFSLHNLSFMWKYQCISQLTLSFTL